MEKTWRWFGKKDKITLDMLRQIGVEGIVTALHDVPNGEIWTEEAINDLKTYIESYGLRWSVVKPACLRGDQVCRTGTRAVDRKL